MYSQNLLKPRLTALVFSTLLLFFANVADAGEVYSFLSGDCRLSTGLVTQVDEQSAILLKLDGHEEVVNLADVQGVYIFSYVTNPVANISAGANLLSTLKQVTVDENPPFYGWPVRFVESLVMFVDIHGKQHVHEMSSITRLRPALKSGGWEKTEYQASGLSFAPLALSFKDLSAQCPNLPSGSMQANRPMRVLSDPVKIRQLMDDLRKGYEGLSDYEERTYLYARPFLFEKASRFGLAIAENGVERKVPWPLDFRWSSGRPFHFQSFTDFGGQHSEYSPYTQQFFGLRSDLKAHVFHMHFESNVTGIPAGTSLYRNLGMGAAADSNFGSYADYGGVSEVQNGMNYLLLMGGDYGALSLSAGYYFPVTAIRVNNTFREILASRKTYAFRAAWTEKTWRLRLIMVPVIVFSSSSPSEKDLTYDRSFQARNSWGTYIGPSSFTFRGHFLRTGVDLEWSQVLSTSLDFVYNYGEYHDTMNPSPDIYEPSTIPTYSKDDFTFHRYSLVAAVRQDFGEYIGVRLYSSWNSFLTEYNMGGTTGTNSFNPLTFGGALEFVF